MSEREARIRRERARQIVRDYFAGPRDKPLIVPHEEGFCVCDALAPWPLHWLRAALRCLMMMVANSVPLSPLKVMLLRALGARVGKGVFISPGTVLDPLYPELIELEDGVLLGMGCRLLTHEYTTDHFRIGRIHIKQGSVIGAYATVRSGVTIGRGVTVGFNSLVNKDVVDGLTVGGVPAKPLKVTEVNEPETAQIQT